MEIREENVLLLSMSTFPPVRKTNYYSLKCEGNAYVEIKNPDEEFKADTQLEPITKFLMKSVKGGLHKIVVMASPETQENQCEICRKKVIDSDTGKCAKLTSEECWGEISPCNFFTGQIERYAKDNEMNIPEIAIVDIEKSAIMRFYQNVIREIKGEGDKTINLFMNMQGGGRTATAQANAIVSLLKNQGVNLCGRYVVEFEASNKTNNIVCVDEEYKSYDFLSAMEIFRRYGKGQALLEFLGNQGRKREKDIKLTNAIEQVSDAIRLCDMDGFDTALSEIGRLQHQFEPIAVSDSQDSGDEQTETEITEFDLVFQDIYDDYKDILPEAGKSKIVEQIAWCRKKGLLQQALTIIESKMPKVLFGGLFSCELTEFVEVMKQRPRQAWQRKVSTSGPVDERLCCFAFFTKKAIGKRWEPHKNFIVNQWEFVYTKDKETQRPNYYDKLYALVSDSGAVEDMLNEAYLQNSIPVYVTNKKAAGGWERVEIPYSINEGIGQTEFNFFMLLHCFLKKQRNETNHGGHSNSRCNAKQIEALIDVYLEYADDFGLQ